MAIVWGSLIVIGMLGILAGVTKYIGSGHCDCELCNTNIREKVIRFAPPLERMPSTSGPPDHKPITPPEPHEHSELTAYPWSSGFGPRWSGGGGPGGCGSGNAHAGDYGNGAWPATSTERG